MVLYGIGSNAKREDYPMKKLVYMVEWLLASSLWKPLN